MPIRRHWFLGCLTIGLVAGWLAAQVTGADRELAHAGVVQNNGTDGLLALTADTQSGTQVLYLIDPKSKVLSVYEFDPRKTKLKLAAVRQFAADHQLAEFNNDSPQVADIERLVQPR